MPISKISVQGHQCRLSNVKSEAQIRSAVRGQWFRVGPTKPVTNAAGCWLAAVTARSGVGNDATWFSEHGAAPRQARRTADRSTHPNPSAAAPHAPGNSAGHSAFAAPIQGSRLGAVSLTACYFAARNRRWWRFAPARRRWMSWTAPSTPSRRSFEASARTRSEARSDPVRPSAPSTTAGRRSS